MKRVFKRIQELARLGDSLARRGAYSWALVRYAQAAAMGEGLATLHVNGGITMTTAEIETLQAIISEVRRLTVSARSKLGNGHGLSGKHNDWPLSELAGILIEEMDAVFFAQ